MTGHILSLKQTASLVVMGLVLCGMIAGLNPARAEAPRSRFETDREIMLARQLAECSAAYYASSEIVDLSSGSAETSKDFHEKANGYLLAAAWKLNTVQPEKGFKSAFERAEKRSGEFKAKWMDHVAVSGHTGVENINEMTKNCTANLASLQQSIVQKMRHIRSGAQ